MKEVYVDASPESGIVTVFSKGSRRVWIIEPISRDTPTHEAEYFAIITALRNIEGDFALFSDSSNVEILNKVLNSNSKAPKKHYPYVETIKQLRKDRKVKFIQISGEQNKADLSEHTRILLEEEGVKP
jgi:ribonuclease HI